MVLASTAAADSVWRLLVVKVCMNGRCFWCLWVRLKSSSRCVRGVWCAVTVTPRSTMKGGPNSWQILQLVAPGSRLASAVYKEAGLHFHKLQVMKLTTSAASAALREEAAVRHRPEEYEDFRTYLHCRCCCLRHQLPIHSTSLEKDWTMVSFSACNDDASSDHNTNVQ